MHTLGKVLLWFNVLGAAGACVLTAKMWDVRGSWIKKIDDLQDKAEQNAKQLAEKEQEYLVAENDFKNTMIGWDRYWQGVNAGLTVQGPKAILRTNNLGSAQGLGSPDPALRPEQQPRPDNPSVYAFQGDQQGQNSVYIGEFKVTNLQPGQSDLESTWTLRPNDFKNQNPQSPWRFRTMVPAKFLREFVNLRTDLEVTERRLKDKQRALAEQQEQDQEAQQILDIRTAQLQGGGNTPGIVADMESEEEKRNVELAELDRLRREVRDTYLRMTQLIEENAALESKLSGE